MRGPSRARLAEETAEPEESLVVAARLGNREAFGALFEQYASMVHGILLARVPSAEADDLMQDVFLTAIEKVGTLREEGAFGAWLAMIARNRVIDFFRTRKAGGELPDNLAVRDDARSEAEQVLAIIRSLPEAYREPLILRLVEGMTGPEIAARVGMTADSVRVNLHRGMKLLRAQLGEEGEP